MKPSACSHRHAHGAVATSSPNALTPRSAGKARQPWSSSRLSGPPRHARPPRDDPLLTLTGTTGASELRLGLIGGGDRVDADVDADHLDTVVRRDHLDSSRGRQRHPAGRAIVRLGVAGTRVAPILAIVLGLPTTENLVPSKSVTGSSRGSARERADPDHTDRRRRSCPPAPAREVSGLSDGLPWVLIGGLTVRILEAEHGVMTTSTTGDLETALYVRAASKAIRRPWTPLRGRLHAGAFDETLTYRFTRGSDVADVPARDHLGAGRHYHRASRRSPRRAGSSQALNRRRIAATVQCWRRSFRASTTQPPSGDDHRKPDPPMPVARASPSTNVTWPDRWRCSSIPVAI